MLYSRRSRAVARLIYTSALRHYLNYTAIVSTCVPRLFIHADSDLPLVAAATPAADFLRVNANKLLTVPRAPSSESALPRSSPIGPFVRSDRRLPLLLLPLSLSQVQLRTRLLNERHPLVTATRPSSNYYLSLSICARSRRLSVSRFPVRHHF